jgi:ribosomal protein S18 acetylase RimI-like enzyme
MFILYPSELKIDRIKEVNRLDSDEFSQALDIYRSCFGSSIFSRPIHKVIDMLRNDESYHLLVAIDNVNCNNLVVGISLFYIFSLLKIGLLDYLAVSPKYRQRGIGKALFDYTFDRVCNEMPEAVGLIVEVQKENKSSLEENIISKHRINFYGRLGTRIIDVRYLIPAQYGHESKEMYLMIKPRKKIDSMSKDSLVKYLDAIHSTIYQNKSNDLISFASHFLPTQIELIDIPV